ncbi:outer membrane protein [Microbulbifer agarilyticus]|uniref:outer membrane protein n=1 Tax=Microbulbifer agarilyticus TaxID=260552 RepID=UPI001CD7CACB|nr:outer membrane beta-barrel protein [Microbulbifer agarilyticus]MCA0894659.1 porin family protein [Microbulbifer agarilyticus]
MVRLLLLLVVPLSLLASSPASADFYSHRYGGLAIQSTALDDVCGNSQSFVSGLNSSNQLATFSNCSDSGEGAKLYAGWRWSPNFALEADLRQSTSATSNFAISNPQFPSLFIKDRVTTRMGNAFFVSHLPVGGSGLSVFGKIGGGFWFNQIRSLQRGDTLAVVQLQDGSLQAVTFPVEGEFNESASGFHWGYGAGVSYRLRDRWTIRAEWELFPEVGGDTTRGEYQLESASLGWSVIF